MCVCLAGLRVWAARQLHLSMVVAVLAVRMMQAAIDQIVDMVSMRYGLMAAASTMHMRSVMTGRRLIGGTAIRILRADI